MIAALDVTPGQVYCMAQATDDARIMARTLANLSWGGEFLYRELRYDAVRYASLASSLLSLQSELACAKLRRA